MKVFIVFDPLGNEIIVSLISIEHIVGRHPEISGNFDFILKTIEFPEIIKESACDKKVLLYYKSFHNNYFVVISKIEQRKGFVITAYIAEKIKLGGTIWKK